MIFAVMTEAMPAPRDFRGVETGIHAVERQVAITNRGVYVPRAGLGRRVDPALLIGVFLASIAGIWAFRRYAKARQEATGDILPVFWMSASAC
jgi:general L-amino acid transport system permease protein